MSKKKRKDSSLTSKLKQYQCLKSELNQLEKFIAAGKKVEEKVRISLLLCGATDLDLEEDIPPLKLRKNLFEQFDVANIQDECALSTTVNDNEEQSKNVTVSNVEIADSMNIDADYEASNESSNLGQKPKSKGAEKIPSIFKDNQAVVIKKLSSDEKQSKVGSIEEHKQSQIVEAGSTDKNEQSQIVKVKKKKRNSK